METKDGPKPLKKRFVKWLKNTARPAFNRYLAGYSEIGDPVVFDAAVFPWAAELEAHWQEIRREAEAVLQMRQHIPAFQEVSPDQYRISDNDDWKTFWLRGFGIESPYFTSLCPVTARLVAAVPGVENALFSILAPGKHIPSHKGVSKAIVNYHLGLIVPRDRESCHMRVGDQRFYWEEGSSRVFDDTNPHEVWNDTDEDRVVLMLQFRRPLRSPGRQVCGLFLKAIQLTPYVRVAKRNQNEYERRFRQAMLARDAVSAAAE